MVLVMNDFKTTLKVLCAYRNTNTSMLAEKMGISRQAVHNKMKRNSFSLGDIVAYCDKLDYNVEMSFIDRETGETVIRGSF